MKLTKQKLKDTEASADNITLEKPKTLNKTGDLSLVSNKAYVFQNISECIGVRVYPNETYAVCNVGRENCGKKGMEVNVAPNEANTYRNLSRCKNVRVFPNEAYSMHKKSKKEEPVYEMVKSTAPRHVHNRYIVGSE